MTSPFLKTWIARWEPSQFDHRSAWHYDSPQRCLDVIQRFGGLPIVAHPTNDSEFYLGLQNVGAIEIYNASFRFHFLEGKFSQDKNLHFRAVWDDLLTHKSSRIFGYAVNDWYGPFNKEVAVSHPDVFDSGKTLVLIPAFTLDHYRTSLERGAFFAIQDNGDEKGHYPKIEKIEVQPGSIEVKVDSATVNWFFAGVLIDTGPVLELSYLPSNMNYVRAEVSNPNTTVYVQPFSFQPAPDEPNLTGAL